MNNKGQALWCEMLKVRRSKMPWLTALGFAVAPLVGGFFMVILRDPDMARRAGLISAKAQIVAGVADWPTYLGLLSQTTAVGGLLLFGLITSWVFGREYSDRTVKDLLALPTSRSAIVLAKFVVIAVWAGALAAMIYILGLGVGAALALPGGSPQIIAQGGGTLAITACLTIALMSPIAFFASAGHGYLPPMGISILALASAQIIATAGWGEYFPWSIPALYAGLGTGGGSPGLISPLIVILTSAAGMAGTFAWWKWADQTQ